MNIVVLVLSMVVTFSSAAFAGDEYRTFMQPGWVVFEKTKYTQNSKIYRRYALHLEAKGIQNVMMFHCRNTPAVYDYVTVVIPFDYTVKSWSRQTWRNNIPIRFLVNNVSTFDLPAEYLKGEIYIDRTPATDTKIADILQADELAISFGSDDRLFFSLPGRVDRFMREGLPAMGFEQKFGSATFYTTDAAIQDCLAYKAASQQKRR